MTLRANPFRTLPILVAFLLNMVVGPLSPLTPAGSTAVALSGSSFDATDGNLTDDAVPEIDWCSDALVAIRADDEPSGSSDNSYKAAKENELDPEVEDGSIPNNKVDLERLYISNEVNADGDLFVYIGWIRNDTSGTGTISFEMNQSDVVLTNGINHQRTAGDLLIEFNFKANPGSQGGYDVDLTYRTWSGSAWGDAVSLAGFADGSVNEFDPVTDCRNDDEVIGVAQFGEFALNLTDLLGGDCKAFGSLFAKSRSSNQITSELKEVMSPVPVDFTTCSTIKILKEDQFGDPVGGATFTITPDPFDANHASSLDVLDDTGAADYSGADEDPTPGVIELNEVEPYSANGGYQICEKSAPSEDYVKDDTCIKQVVGPSTTVTFGPFVNELLFPELRIEKTPDEGQDPADNAVTAGDDAAFGITLFNDGTGKARGATLEDDLPAVTNGWSIISNPGGEDAWADCEITGSAGAAQHLSCGPEDLAAGDSLTVTVSTETAAPDDCGDLNNPDATADADNADAVIDAGNIDVLCGDLDVEKTPDEDAGDGGLNDIVAGEDAVFSIVTTNKGDGEARGATLEDDLPAVTNGWSIIANPGGEDAWADCEITGSAGAAQHLSCGPEDLAAGDSLTVTLSAATTLADCHTLNNPAADVNSTNDGNDSDSGEIDVICPDVSVDKTTDTPEINASDEARYTITVKASGVGTSENVTLTDNLPDVDGTWAEDSGSCEIAANVLSCAFGDMEPGDEEVVHLSYTTTPDDCGTLSNDVSISSDLDVDPVDNKVEDVEIEVNCPDVKVEKTGSGTVNATDAIFFEITVSNIGEGDAYGFLFSDTLPDVENGWTATELPAFCELDGLAVSCELSGDDFFAAGDSFTIRVEAEGEIADCGTLPNTASASATNEADDDLANNSDGHTIVVECPDLTAAKQADDTMVSAGQQIGFTISVSNADLEDTGTAYDVQLDDQLPFKADGTVDWDIDPAYAGPGTCAITGDIGSEVLHCSFGDMEPGDSASVHVVSGTSKLDCTTYLNVASITSDNHEELTPSDATMVECPGLNISKLADNGTIDAGELASYTIVVWNAGPGTALGASWSDDLPHGVSWSVQLMNPDGDDACASSIDSEGNQSASCQFGDLGVTSKADGKVIKVSGRTDRGDCEGLDNTAFAFASNADTVQASASIEVDCPTVAIVKVNDQPAPVLPGTVVSYTLTVTVGDSQASDVVVTDVLPEGLDAPTSISDDGNYDPTTRTITWELGDLDPGSYPLTYQAAVSLDAEQGDELVNLAFVTSPNSQCPDVQNLADECDDDSIVTVRVPTLVIDKSADTQEVHFVFDADGNVLSVDPEQVTWTLTYTLANGPVTDAVITDPLPDFLVFVSASDGGAYDPVTGIITWELGDLLVDGTDSVSFVTTVDPAAPETDPLVNVATIVSNETPEDDGEDSIVVTSESELGGNPTPKPSVPNTALVFGPAGEPISIPVELMAFVFIGSLGALAFANVRATRRRR